MKGNPAVMEALSGALALERQLNMQYWLSWRCINAYGASKTAGVFKEFKKDTHPWLEKLQDQILMYDRDVSGSVGAVSEKPTLLSTFQYVLGLENALVAYYEKAIATCIEADDHDTRDLFDHLLKGHSRGDRGSRGHVWWLEKQVYLLGTLLSGNEGAYVLEMSK
jgi:bacterioferritin (cytochrome b1)